MDGATAIHAVEATPSAPRGRPQLARLESALFMVFVAGVALLPLPLGSNRAWAWGGFQVLFGGLLAALAALRLSRGRSLAPYQWLPLLALWIGVGLVALHSLPGDCAALRDASALTALDIARSCRMAIDPGGQQALLGQVLLAALVASLALLLLDSTRRVRRLLTVLIVVSATYALAGALSALTGWQFSSEWLRLGTPGRASGPFVNPNHLAGHLEIALGLGVGMMVGMLRDGEGERSWRQWLRDLMRLLLSRKAGLRILLVLLVIGLVTTRSRSGNVAFMMALLLGGVAGLCMRQPPRGLKWLIASLLAFDLLIVGGWFGLDRVAERVGSSFGVAMEQSAEQGLGALAFNLDAERAQVRAAALAMWQQAPLLGLGGGAFRALYPSYRADTASPFYYDHAHNDYLQILAETGVLGAGWCLLLVLGALAFAFLALRRRSRRALHGIALGGMIAVLSLLAHALTDFNLQIPANQCWFALALVLCWLAGTGFPGDPRQERPLVPPRPRPPHEVAGLGSVLSAGLSLVLLAVAMPQQATATTLAQACRSALDRNAAGRDLPLPPATDLAGPRTEPRARPRDEALRQRAAELAVGWWLHVLDLEAAGQQARARAATEIVRTRLADTGWRIQRDSRQGLVPAALAERARVRAGVADAAAGQVACRALLGSPVAGNRLVDFERALCRMREAPGRALVDMQRAASAGHTGAQEALAQLCMRARAPDPVCAARWLCEAAPWRPSAAAAAAFLMIQEPVADMDLVEQLYLRAAQQGDAASANNLGEMHERGMRGQVDYRQAEQWYRKAADAGLTEAQLNLARLWLERDFENPRSRAEAGQLLKQLQPRHPAAVAELLKLYPMSLH